MSAAASTTHSTTPSTSTKKLPRILVVDDTEGNRYAVARTLRLAGMEIVEAANGRDALARAVDRVDLVVLDVNLPDISGHDVLRTLKNTPATARTPVLHLSASNIEGADWAYGLDAGADGYLTHPFDPLVLVATVRSLLRTADMERQLVMAKEEAERANATKADFLATMSHELRTPLNAIAGYVDLLLFGVHGPLTDAQRDDLERVRRSQVHLLSLINDVLSFARLERGGLTIRMDKVVLHDIVRQSAELITPQADAKRVAYSERCDTSLVVHADADKAQQILLNLLGNAVKFTPTGGRVALACERDGDSVLIRVSDTGVGIDAARLADIFEPFVQIDRHLTPTGHQGIGLGLSISRELARAMQGDLTVESEKRAGTTFTLRLQAA
jgi:signal transduction histidine kinase